MSHPILWFAGTILAGWCLLAGGHTAAPTPSQTATTIAAVAVAAFVAAVRAIETAGDSPARREASIKAPAIRVWTKAAA